MSKDTESTSEINAQEVANLNIGALGHVDCGKTSLVKLLSTELSTAALDKHPQSQERGITLDLGFSSFKLGFVPDHWKREYDERGVESSKIPSDVQITLVDCPGHASLIRSIIGGAQIIDMILLVIDVTKGIQTQTAECLVIGEIVTNHMVVVLNKVDLLSEEERETKIDKVSKRVAKTLSQTKFNGAPMIMASAIQESSRDKILEAVAHYAPVPRRQSNDPLLFNIDHCFSLKGKGTILTGTILSGKLSINDTIELPLQGESRKVKSMQQFHTPISSAQQGDRVGVCCAGLDPKSIERAIACSPGYLKPRRWAIAAVRKIRHYKSTIQSGFKFHISVGHSTTLATVTVFGDSFTMKDHPVASHSSFRVGASQGVKFDYDKEFQYRETLEEAEMSEHEHHTSGNFQWLFMSFENPVLVPYGGLLIGSKLDTDIRSKACRIAFFGYAAENMGDRTPCLFKPKERFGKVERVTKGGDGEKIPTEIIGTGMFSKETDMSKFIGKQILCQETSTTFTLESAFGKSGKFKCSTREPCIIEKGTTLVMYLRKYIQLG